MMRGSSNGQLVWGSAGKGGMNFSSIARRMSDAEETASS